MYRLTFHSLLPGAIFFHALVSNVAVVLSAGVNRSIDDTLGDSVTGQKPIFIPSTPGIWQDPTQCSVAPGCALQPPTTSAFDGTYTAATYHPELNNISISFDFTGVATSTAANFTLDGSHAGSFSHSPDNSAPAFQFNESAMAFSMTGLQNGTHQMIISTITGQWVNFDYALYTFEDEAALTTSSASQSPTSLSSSSSTPLSSSTPSSSSSHAGTIAGGVIAGLVAICALIAVIFFCRRRQRRIHQLSSGDHDNNSEIPREINPFMVPAKRRSPMLEYQSSSLGVPRQTFLTYGNVPSDTAPASRLASDGDDLAETTRNQSQYAESSVGALSSNEDQSIHYQSRSVISTLPSGRTVMSPGTTRDYLPATLLSAALPSSGNLDGRAHFLSGIPTSISTDATHPVPTLVPAPNTKAELRHMRQRELGRQMRVINAEMEDLKNDAAEHATTSSVSLVSRRSTRKSIGVDGNLDVAKMKEQIKAMSEQITLLQSQQRSSWAQGLSDEPPPGYHNYADANVHR
ncbi:hypothetical protein BT96DRAFT_1008812 [Gymnopus androsaceus JB14]|uniref:Mid2 domain-containing protein n=1 Tax=Gymnopus androsaceus JB14 TaxID=1447944 RepID=A0A6A4GEG4_9AGAR|nr:hypothetical protein BT96DRAFT_1008812 [Gymnopus androsaceus JB14]